MRSEQEGTRKLHKQVAQILMVPALIASLLLSQPTVGEVAMTSQHGGKSRHDFQVSRMVC